MKTQSLKTLVALGAFVLLAAASARAQSETMRAHVPFEFGVGGKTLPAGEYNVERLRRDAEPAALALKSADGKTRALVLARVGGRGTAGTPSKLIFDCYGEQRFLAQVWSAADNARLELLHSRSERDFARRLRRQSRLRQEVALAPGPRR